MTDENNIANLVYSSDKKTLSAEGAWTLNSLSDLCHQFSRHINKARLAETIDTSKIVSMDSAGALLLYRLSEKIKAIGGPVTFEGWQEEHLATYELLKEQQVELDKPVIEEPLPNWFYRVGVWSHHKIKSGFDFFDFVGYLMMTIFRVAYRPWSFHWRNMFSVMEETGYHALPILGLLSFLVGVVLTYQIAIQLETYGANIYIVDLAGMITLREFGPLIAAIIVAGRTATAFAAQIGTMKVNEEIDALRTMGVVPAERIVLPKILGLILVMPLLVVWSDIFGVLGSMFMSKILLGIHYYSYLNRFQQVILVRHFFVGIIKAPVFAMLIATVGCFQGFQVVSNANSVGQKTTQAAVQSIFLIVIADALFSVLFNWRGM